MNFENQLSRVALALGMGLLIGLERGWSTRDAPSGSRAAGVRTFAICGLMGGLLGAMAFGPGRSLTLEGSVLLGAAFIAFSAVICIFGVVENRAAGRYSATTTVAALLTFVLGAYAAIGDVRIAAGSAVAAAALLIFRQGLHEWVARITRIEFESAQWSKGDFGRQLGRRTQLHHGVVLAQFAVFRLVSSSLPHEPDGRMLDGLASAGPKKKIITQCQLPRPFYSGAM